MDLSTGWAAIGLWAGGALLAAVGAAVVILALFRDRARGRRRCPRCWYDMGGVPALTCPECGRTARSERRLGKTRRRWRRATIGFVILMIGVGTILAPMALRDGPLAVLPMPILIQFAPRSWDDRTWDPVKQLWVLDPVAEEIGRRLRSRTLSAWEWRMLLERVQVVRMRSPWLADTYAALECRLPNWFGVDSIFVSSSDGKTVFVDLPWTDVGRGGPPHRSVRVPAGARRIEFEIRLSTSGWMAERLFDGTISVPVRAVSDINEVIAPDRSAATDAYIRKELRAFMGESEFEHKHHDGLSLFIALSEQELKSVGVAVRAELLDGDAVIESHEALLVPNPKVFQSGVTGESAAWVPMTFKRFPAGQAYTPEARSRWSVRLRGLPDGLPNHFDKERYWAGEIVLPVEDLVRRRRPQ